LAQHLIAFDAAKCTVPILLLAVVIDSVMYMRMTMSLMTYTMTITMVMTMVTTMSFNVDPVVCCNLQDK